MNFELGYNFVMFARDSTIAVAYQQTQQALSLGLPEDRVLAVLTVALDDSTTLSFEWAHDNDYSMSDAGLDDSGSAITGSGNSADAVTLQLAAGF